MIHDLFFPVNAFFGSFQDPCGVFPGLAVPLWVLGALRNRAVLHDGPKDHLFVILVIQQFLGKRSIIDAGRVLPSALFPFGLECFQQVQIALLGFLVFFCRAQFHPDILRALHDSLDVLFFVPARFIGGRAAVSEALIKERLQIFLDDLFQLVVAFFGIRQLFLVQLNQFLIHVCHDFFFITTVEQDSPGITHILFGILHVDFFGFASLGCKRDSPNPLILFCDLPTLFNQCIGFFRRRHWQRIGLGKDRLDYFFAESFFDQEGQHNTHLSIQAKRFPFGIIFIAVLIGCQVLLHGFAGFLKVVAAFFPQGVIEFGEYLIGIDIGRFYVLFLTILFLPNGQAFSQSAYDIHQRISFFDHGRDNTKVLLEFIDILAVNACGCLECFFYKLTISRICCIHYSSHSPLAFCFATIFSRSSSGRLFK